MASPFSPGGRMFQKPPPSFVPYGCTGVSAGSPGRPGSWGSPGSWADAAVARTMATASAAIATQMLSSPHGAADVRAPFGRAPVPLRQDRHRVRGDRLDLLRGPLELLVREHGVPSNGRSRYSSSHERQPWYSGRTFTVTGRGMR